MKNLLFILALTQCAVAGYAQTSLRPGYIVTTDTIRGEVVYHEGVQATRICSFKKQGAAETTDYSPADIKGYGFESRHFTSLVYNGNRQFMEVIVTGLIRLLRSQKSYYLVKDSTFVLLETRKKEKYNDGQRFEYEDKAWLARVKPMLSDCKATAQALDAVQLSELSPKQLEHQFSKVIAQYNECHGEKTTVYHLPKDKRWFSMGLFGGVATSTAKFVYTGGDDKYNGSSAPAFGVWFEFRNQRVSERFRFRTEVSYTKVEADGVNEYYGVRRAVTYSAIKVPLFIHYSFSSGRIAPFVRAGVVYIAPFNSEYSLQVRGIATTASSELIKLKAPLVVAGGLETTLSPKLRGYFEARYEFPTSVYGDKNTPTRVEVYQMAFLVGVGF